MATSRNPHHATCDTDPGFSENRGDAVGEDQHQPGPDCNPKSMASEHLLLYQEHVAHVGQQLLASPPHGRFPQPRGSRAQRTLNEETRNRC
jgi:hypothetical protein